MSNGDWDIELCDSCLKIASCRFVSAADQFICAECDR